MKRAQAASSTAHETQALIDTALLQQHGKELRNEALRYKNSGSDITILHAAAQKCTDFMSSYLYLAQDQANESLWKTISELITVVTSTSIDSTNLTRAMFNFDLVCPYNREESEEFSSGIASSDALVDTTGEHPETND